ncbi:MAG: hypothetical protein ACOC5M_01790 [Chloroflexota bacterium]
MTDIFQRYQDLKSQHAARDQRHFEISAARRGDVHVLLPGMFPDNWPKQATANVVSIASQDTGEMLAGLPSINCRPRASTQVAQKRASMKNRIAASYVDKSELPSHTTTAGDRFASFGHMAFVVDPNFEEGGPEIRVNDFPVGAYYTLDLKGRTVEYFKAWTEPAGDLAAKFPEYRDYILDTDVFGNEVLTEQVEIVKAYVWDNAVVDWDFGPPEAPYDEPIEIREKTPVCMLFLPSKGNVTLKYAPYYGLTRLPVRIAERPRWDEEIRGQFDEALWVQVARARMELFTLQAADEAINAPIQIPADVTKLPTGPRAIFRSNSDREAHRVALDIPNDVFAENERLRSEERVAARYPEGRSGNIDASVITGQGVEKLLGTIDTQLKSYQNVIGRAFKEALSIAFEMDELYWGGEEKHIEGTLDGELFEDTYDPAKDIAGDYRVDVTYGFAAGLDPNRALVFLLQLRGDRLIDKDTVMRQMPFDIDVNAVKERIDKEDLEDALKQGLFQLAVQIGAPEFAALGIDPRKVVQQIGTIMDQREKGKALHEAVLKAFEPTKEELAAQQAANQTPIEQLAAEEQGGQPAPTQAGAAAPPPGSRSEIQMLLSGLSSAGRPNLQANRSIRTER